MKMLCLVEPDHSAYSLPHITLCVNSASLLVSEFQKQSVSSDMCCMLSDIRWIAMTKIAIAQLNLTVGAFEENRSKIIHYLQESERQGAALMVASELALSGYPPQDLLLHPHFRKAHEVEFQKLLAETKKINTELLIGAFREEDGKLYNSAFWIASGSIIARWDKTVLPSYDVFDEARYFEPAHTHTPFVERFGKKWGVLICEEMWTRTTEHRVKDDQADELLFQHPVDAVLVLNASPFQLNKFDLRKNEAIDVCKRLKTPLIYVNQVMAVDHLIFDGHSFITNAKGNVTLELPEFQEALEVFDFDSTVNQSTKQKPTQANDTLKNALVFGIREYVQKSRHKGVVLGLSGGIDSALVACLAAEAVGPKNVHAIALPGPFNKDYSLSDAQELAKNTGIHFIQLNIHQVLQTASKLLGERIQDLEQGLAYENLQSRIRGLLLMAYANSHQLLCLATGNKSEIAVGYCTLYGDTNGAMAPLGDVLKTQVYSLCRFINAKKEIIPQRIIERPPSAELRENQTDQDSLPPYDTLDALIDLHIVQQKSADEISKIISKDLAFIKKWILRIEGAEFKRRQIPFSLRVSGRAFDSGRRIPILKSNQFI